MPVPIVIRESLIENIHNALQKGHYVVCICPERSGLSYALQQLGNYVVSKGSDTRYGLIDISTLDPASRERFCTLFGHILCNTGSSLAEYVSPEKPAFSCLADLCINAPFSTIIALDNFHKLPISSQKEFLTESRRFHTEKYTQPSYQKVLLVIGGAIDLCACQPDETSPFNIADKIHPTDFDFSRDEAKNYLTQRLPLANLYVDEITQNYVYELTRGQVYFLEKLCDKLVNQLQGAEPVEVSIDEIDNTVATLLEDRDAYLDGLLEKIRNLEPDTKVLLSEILGSKRHKFSRLNHSIRELELLGVLREEHHLTSIRSPLLDLCIRESSRDALSPPVAPKNLIMPKVIGGNLRAYQILFELENEIRNFIVSGLYARYKAKWFDFIPESDGWNQAKGRHSKHRKDAWKRHQTYPLLAYSFFGDLKEAIKDNWNIFGNHFQPQDKFFGYFDRLEELRNDVAHNRPLSYQNLRELESIRKAFENCMIVS